MNIELHSGVPPKDGFYLMRFNQKGGLHLVLIQTDISGQRILVPDNPYKPGLVTMSINEAHGNLLGEALFSDLILCNP